MVSYGYSHHYVSFICAFTFYYNVPIRVTVISLTVEPRCSYKQVPSATYVSCSSINSDQDLTKSSNWDLNPTNLARQTLVLNITDSPVFMSRSNPISITSLKILDAEVANKFYGTNLTMSQNVMNRIDVLLFDGIRNIVHLNLSNNSISTLNPQCFGGIKRLALLDLSRNNIREFGAEAFVTHIGGEGLPGGTAASKLVELYLDGNPLKVLSLGKKWLPLLTKLSLTNCSLTTPLLDKFFPPHSLLPNVRYLSLGLNLINLVPDHMKERLRNGDYYEFAINGNPLICDCGAVSFLRSFKTWIANRILAGASISTNNLEGTSCALELNEMVIHVLDAEFYTNSTCHLTTSCPFRYPCVCASGSPRAINCYHVEERVLYHGSSGTLYPMLITKTPDPLPHKLSLVGILYDRPALNLTWLSGVRNLTDLTLSRSKTLKHIPAKALTSVCFNLLTFVCAHCALTTLEDESFSGCHKLSNLVLRSNMIIVLPMATFSNRHLPVLGNLSLDDNSITHFGDGDFSYNLRSIYMEGNPIKHLSGAFLEKSDLVSTLKFTGYPFCDCGTLIMSRWLMERFRAKEEGNGLLADLDSLSLQAFMNDLYCLLLPQNLSNLFPTNEHFAGTYFNLYYKVDTLRDTLTGRALAFNCSTAEERAALSNSSAASTRTTFSTKGTLTDSRASTTPNSVTTTTTVRAFTKPSRSTPKYRNPLMPHGSDLDQDYWDRFENGNKSRYNYSELFPKIARSGGSRGSRPISDHHTMIGIDIFIPFISFVLLRMWKMID